MKRVLRFILEYIKFQFSKIFAKKEESRCSKARKINTLFLFFGIKFLIFFGALIELNTNRRVGSLSKKIVISLSKKKRGSVGMVTYYFHQIVLSCHTKHLSREDPTAPMSRPKLRSNHMYVVLGVCLAPIKGCKDSNIGIVQQNQL